LDSNPSEDGFQVERRPKIKKNQGVWGVIATTASTSWTDDPGDGSWEYRVRAYRDSETSDASNAVVAKVGGKGNGGGRGRNK